MTLGPGAAVERRRVPGLAAALAGAAVLLCAATPVHAGLADRCARSGVTLNCTGLALGEVPRDIPTDIVYLILNNNGISELRDGSFDHLSSLIELHLAGNDIRLVEDGVWDSQLARDPAVSRLLYLDMTGSNSLCTLALGDIGASTASEIWCTCPLNYQLAPLTPDGRAYCGLEGSYSPTASRAPSSSLPTAAPTAAPTASAAPTTRPTATPTAPSLAPSTRPSVDPTATPTAPTSAPSTPGPTTTSPTRVPTLQVTYWDNVFNSAEAARGCCTAATGALYNWYKYGGHTIDSCKALCDGEPACRGIEYPWSTAAEHFLQCYLLFDDGASPARSPGFSDAGLYDPAAAWPSNGAGPITAATLACERTFNLCFRRCIPFETGNPENFCPRGADGTIRTSTLTIPHHQQITMQFARAYTNLPPSLQIGPAGPFAIQASDRDPSNASKTIFNIGVRGIVCGSSASLAGVVPGPACDSLVRVYVLALYAVPIDARAEASAVQFYVAYNNMIVDANALTAAMLRYTAPQMQILFVAPVASVYSAPAPTGSPTTSPTASPLPSAEKPDSLLQLLLLSMGLMVVFVMLIMASVYTYGRLISIQHSISTIKMREIDSDGMLLLGAAALKAQKAAEDEADPFADFKPPHERVKTPPSSPARHAKAVPAPGGGAGLNPMAKFYDQVMQANATATATASQPKPGKASKRADPRITTLSPAANAALPPLQLGNTGRSNSFVMAAPVPRGAGFPTVPPPTHAASVRTKRGKSARNGSGRGERDEIAEAIKASGTIVNPLFAGSNPGSKASVLGRTHSDTSIGNTSVKSLFGPQEYSLTLMHAAGDNRWG